MDQQIKWLWLGLLISTSGWLGYNFIDFNNKVNSGEITIEKIRALQNPTEEANQNLSTSQSNAEVNNSSVPELLDRTIDNQEPSVDVPNIDSPAVLIKGQGVDLNNILQVETNNYFIKISLNGGNIIELKLKKYPVSIKQKDIPTILLRADRYPYVLQSGVLSKGTSFNHHSPFSSDGNNYVLEGDANQLTVRLVSENGDFRLIKEFEFFRNSHQINLTQTIENNSRENWSGAGYAQLSRTKPSEEGNAFIYTYTGSAWWSEESGFNKIDFDEIASDSPTLDAKDGWISMLQHYFLSVIIPPNDIENRFYTRKSDDKYIIGSISPQQVVAPNSTGVFENKLFIGPKNQEELVTAHPSLDYAVDYGIFHILSAPLFWILKQFYDIFGNWAVAIILITILIKLIFYKLSEKSYRSMARMKLLTPRIQQLRERYGDDKQALNQKMMKIYKEEKVNPLGGCLPVLVQIPVFISLYWTLIESVELRQAPFMLWIQDLSIADPYFILPILMGITMYAQQKLNPSMGDPMQQKILQFLPVIFTVFFLFFPAGLVLYWIVNNILSIAQQWYITRKLATEQT